MNMKNIKHIRENFTSSLAMLAIAGLMALPFQTSAQEKGAARLTRLNAIKTVADAEAVQAGDTIVMSCPKCKDTWVTVVERPSKTGAAAREITSVRHECPGCENKYASEGHGKARTDRIVHVCKNCGSQDAFCCVMKKGAGPTPGMEKK
jgi:hypothetical protein